MISSTLRRGPGYAPQEADCRWPDGAAAGRRQIIVIVSVKEIVHGAKIRTCATKRRLQAPKGKAAVLAKTGMVRRGLFLKLRIGADRTRPGFSPVPDKR